MSYQFNVFTNKLDLVGLTTTVANGLYARLDGTNQFVSYVNIAGSLIYGTGSVITISPAAGIGGFDFSGANSAAGKLQMVNADIGSNGTGFTVQADTGGNTFLGDVDKNGGDLILSAGQGTGAGTANVIIKATGGGVSGSTTANPATVATLARAAITFVSGYNVILNTTTGTKWGTGATQKQGWWGATAVVQDTGWSATNVTTDRVFDANSTSLDELSDIVGTLINQLKTYGILGA